MTSMADPESGGQGEGGGEERAEATPLSVRVLEAVLSDGLWGWGWLDGCATPTSALLPLLPHPRPAAASAMISPKSIETWIR